MKQFACSRRTAGVERMSTDYDWDYEQLKNVAFFVMSTKRIQHSLERCYMLVEVLFALSEDGSKPSIPVP